MEYISPVLKELLTNRGITGEKEMEEFLSPSPQKTYDPFLMLGMREGVELVLKYARSGEKICIYGDYDADGITSVAIMMKTMNYLTDNVFYYIPSRFDEGYGLNMDAIDQIHQKGTKLIITVDCGSVAYDEVEHIKSLGMEILVTDHHNLDERKADCLILNPKQKECSYPFKELAGCGVAFKLSCALQRKAGLERRLLTEILDLVAVGTIGDIVPLVDENRTLVKYGLKAIRSGNRKGLLRLFEGMNINQRRATEEHIAYTIVPHLNAAGRISDAALGAKVLISEDEGVLRDGVAELIERNRTRKKLQNETYLKCVEIVENQLQGDQFLAIRCEEAHEGITGIVAGKIKDRYHRPAVILTPAADGLKGTGRSIPGVNLYDLLKDFEGGYEKFGGHAGACGFTLEEGAFERFRDEMNQAVDGMLKGNPMLLEEEVSYDMELGLNQVSERLCDEISLLSPFGQKNERPVFKIANAAVSEIFYMGDQSQHVRFHIRDLTGGRVKCVYFQKAQEVKKLLEASRPVSIYGSLEISEWRGRKDVQMMVSHIMEE